MKILSFVFLLLLSKSIVSQNIIINVSAPISDFIAGENTITVSTLAGTIENYNIKSEKLINSISFPKIKDFTGETIVAEVFRIAKVNNTIYAIVHGQNGFNDIYKVVNKKPIKIFTGKTLNSVAISIVRSSETTITLGLLSNELITFSTVSEKILYKKQVSNYAFSAMAISTDMKYIFTTDESGEVHKVNSSDGNVIKSYKGENVDNVLCIDYANGNIVCGGKDRRFSVYQTFINSSHHIITESFITSVSISPSGNLAVWQDDITNNLELYDISRRVKLKSLKGNTSMVSKIIFYSENKIISCSSDNKIIIWNI